MKVRLLLLLLLSISPSILFSKEISLFSNGTQRFNYNKLVSSIQPGDILYFESGDRFEIVSSLGEGNTTKILKARILGMRYIGEPKYVALRIPLKLGRVRSFLPNGTLDYTKKFVDFINYTIAGYKQIRTSSRSFPKLYRSHENQFIATEIIEDHIPLTNFITNPPEKGSIERKEMTRKLLEFAKSVSKYYAFGDFHPGQLVYEKAKKRWVLLDWTAIFPNTEKAPIPVNEVSPFDSRFRVRAEKFLYGATQEASTVPAWVDNILRKLDTVVKRDRSKQISGCKFILGLLKKRGTE